MRSRFLFLLAGGAAAATLFTADDARAQTEPTQGFSLNRFEPAERGSEWFAADTMDFRGKARPAIGATFDWGHKPLVVYNPDGSERTALVQNQVFVHIGAAFVLSERIRFGFNLPVAVYQQGTAASVQGVGPIPGASGTAVGDLRLGATARLIGMYGDPITVGLGVWAFLPTGDSAKYTSDGSVRLLPHFVFAGDISSLAYSARVGPNLRFADRQFVNSPVGTELSFQLAAGLRLVDKKLLIGPELWGSTVVASDTNGDSVAFKRATTPLELVGGMHYTAGDFRFGVGAGSGLTRGYGTPQVRVLASIEWIPAISEEAAPVVVAPPPPPAPVDTDKDGILDKDDACKDIPGIKQDDPSKNGCPPDKDGDGIYDADDACPNTAGIKSDDPKKNGCPPDKDDDGILDADDACIDVPGIKHEDPKKNGCPSDKDGDGILDTQDACPEVPGPANADPKKNGCPTVAVVGDQIKIWEKVKFKTGSAVIEKESDELIGKIATVLVDHPEITKVRVEGHTDNKGQKGANKTLSKSRAQSVVNALVKKGVDKKRLFAEGYGQDNPIDTNDTDEGRANNRRVEFHIVPTAKPGDAPAKPGAAPAKPATPPKK